jgi:hypothetical protein
MTDAVQGTSSEFHRQRARWFLLLGGVLGGVILLSEALGFALEVWGNHIGGGRHENVQGITWGMAVAFFLSAVVVAFVLWRAVRNLRMAERFDEATPSSPAPAAASPVSSAVAAWKSAAISRSQAPQPARATAPAGAPEPAAAPAEMPVPIVAAPLSAPALPAATELVAVFGRGQETFPDAMQALGTARVEPEALWTGTAGGQDQLHIVVKDPAAAEPKLVSAGLRVVARKLVLLVDLEDRPGAAGEMFRRLHEAGVKVGSAHLASNTRMVVSTDDLDAVRRALS